MKKYINSIFSLALSIFISNSSLSQCDYLINMQDSFGDGWNGASIDVSVNGTIVNNLTIPTGSTGSGSISTYTNDIVEFISTLEHGTVKLHFRLQIQQEIH